MKRALPSEQKELSMTRDGPLPSTANSRLPVIMKGSSDTDFLKISSSKVSSECPCTHAWTWETQTSLDWWHCILSSSRGRDTAHKSRKHCWPSYCTDTSSGVGGKTKKASVSSCKDPKRVNKILQITWNYKCWQYIFFNCAFFPCCLKVFIPPKYPVFWQLSKLPSCILLPK